MSELVKETLCTHCIKRNVCCFKENFRDLITQTDKIPKENIHAIKITCSEYILNQVYRGEGYGKPRV